MFANPDYNNISIANFKREIFMTFMLELYVYVTSSLTAVYLKVIAKEYSQQLFYHFDNLQQFYLICI